MENRVKPGRDIGGGWGERVYVYLQSYKRHRKMRIGEMLEFKCPVGSRSSNLSGLPHLTDEHVSWHYSHHVLYLSSFQFRDGSRIWELSLYLVPFHSSLMFSPRVKNGRLLLSRPLGTFTLPSSPRLLPSVGDEESETSSWRPETSNVRGVIKKVEWEKNWRGELIG